MGLSRNEPGWMRRALFSATEDPKVADSTSELEAKDAMLATEQRKLAQPKPHRFELSPE